MKARNDLNWHRTFVWLSGFLGVPEFRYTLTIWSLPTTQQTLVSASCGTRCPSRSTLGVGIAPNLTSRSMQGSWPFWAASDRQMGEEFFRGGFSSGFFVTGEPISTLSYTASINTNLSQLGVTATNDTRDLAYSGSLCLDAHHRASSARAADSGTSKTIRSLPPVSACPACHTPRRPRAHPVGPPNGETQIRLSDGVYLFEEGALADGVTVRNADYDYLSFDAAAPSTRGSASRASTTSAVSRSSMPSMAISPRDRHSTRSTTTASWSRRCTWSFRRSSVLYACGGYVFDDFKRKPWEVAGGASFYPYGEPELAAEPAHHHGSRRAPTGSNFGYYTAGQSGTTFSLGTDILL